MTVVIDSLQFYDVLNKTLLLEKDDFLLQQMQIQKQKADLERKLNNIRNVSFSEGFQAGFEGGQPVGGSKAVIKVVNRLIPPLISVIEERNKTGFFVLDESAGIEGFFTLAGFDDLFQFMNANGLTPGGVRNARELSDFFKIRRETRAGGFRIGKISRSRLVGDLTDFLLPTVPENERDQLLEDIEDSTRRFKQRKDKFKSDIAKSKVDTKRSEVAKIMAMKAGDIRAIKGKRGKTKLIKMARALDLQFNENSVTRQQLKDMILKKKRKQ